MSPAPLLIVGVGNPSRGDDAVGPLFVERVAEHLAADVQAGFIEVLTDFQLQIEHALDLRGRRCVVFVDAHVNSVQPFSFLRVPVQRDPTHSSHAMSPSAVLETHQRILGPPPPAWSLAIQGQQFDLGAPLSKDTQAALAAALQFFVDWYRQAATADPAAIGVRVDVRGTVQGVGFRPFVARRARALGLVGQVRNSASAVTIEAFGSRAQIDALIQTVQQDAPLPAYVEHVALHSLPWTAHREFVIADSAGDAAADLPLPPDLSLCGACCAELTNPGSRFAGYAFTSCTACGPRYSITSALPFDREHTSLRDFPLCPACSASYHDPADRRWHAQTMACPGCGPALWLADPAGQPLPASDPLAAAAAQLRAGQIVGILGIGGLHLVCDAGQEATVQTLRRRKGRDGKPLAVMVADLDMAHSLAVIDEFAARELGQPACPIVLVPRRDSSIAPSVCASSQHIGLMLPYTPLHHLLLTAVGRPLVMTSGNRAGEPIEIDPASAVARLGDVVDRFVFHNRTIVRRVEDSVVMTTEQGPLILRRARGYAPRPLRLPLHASQPILAVGGQLKNTVCVVIEDRAYLSPHLGDLHTVESEQAWQRELEGLERLLQVSPQIIAHDLHPDYVSTRYALRRPAHKRLGVQHHHAHVLAAIAEHSLQEPVLAVAFDGSGWGPDGTSWGGEILQVDGLRLRRLATLRPLPLPGGEIAIREVFRQAMGLLFDAFGDAAGDVAVQFPHLRSLADPKRDALLRMLATGVQCVGVRGVGRYFDAVGSLILGHTHAAYEAHVVIDLEQHATTSAVEPYPWLVSTQSSADPATYAAREIDLRPTTRALVADLLHGVAREQIAARFHATLAAATLYELDHAQQQTGPAPVVLTGGALQNRWLQRALCAGLGAAARLPRAVPVNDGGLSLGQAYAAVIALRASSFPEV